MNEHDHQIAQESAASAKSLGYRRLLIFIGFIFCLIVLLGGTAMVSSYLTVRSTAESGTELAQQIKQECETTIPDADLAQFCPTADTVVDEAPDDVKTIPVPGPPGPAGTDGTDGTDGDDGVDGSDGRNGNPGRRGAQGPAGTDGQDGAEGPPGPIGPVGPAGPVGPPGQDGQDGQDGAQGPPGVSNLVDGCPPAADGEYVVDVNTVQDPDTRVWTISCTYSDDSIIEP